MKTEIKKVYLDNMATTPVLPWSTLRNVTLFNRVVWQSFLSTRMGWCSRDAMEMARGQVADLIGGNPEEIIFTGSGTESNNMALKGLGNGQQKKGKHIVVSSIEHFSVLTRQKHWKSGDLNIPWCRWTKMVLLTRKMSGKQSVTTRFWCPSCMPMGNRHDSTHQGNC